jgi:hypothetical protein
MFERRSDRGYYPALDEIERRTLAHGIRTAVSLLGLILAGAVLPSAEAADTVTVRPQEIDDVLINPGIGFTTFQRSNGDRLNEGLKWTEGFPISEPSKSNDFPLGAGRRPVA